MASRINCCSCTYSGAGLSLRNRPMLVEKDMTKLSMMPDDPIRRPSSTQRFKGYVIDWSYSSIDVEIIQFRPKAPHVRDVRVATIGVDETEPVFTNLYVSRGVP
jgi:hypothetical protein